MAAYEVRDGARLLQFEGIILGAVSSRKNDSPRWTDMTLYRTVGGSYVLEKVGASIVTHMPGCPEVKPGLLRFQDAHPGEDPDDYEYHEDCVPEEYDFTTLLVESDRCWATVSDDPNEIIEGMRIRKKGAAHMPSYAHELLEGVALVEQAFKDAWSLQHIA